MRATTTARALLATLLLVSAALASGCLRRRFDLCAETPPHPECPSRDAGRDASEDAPQAPDAGPADVGPDAP